MNIKVLASGSDGNCYRISDGQTSVLLDAGISIQQIRRGCDFDLAAISGCLVTHCHGDHTKGVKALLGAAVSVYMPEDEIEATKTLAGLQKHHRLHPLEKNETGYTPFDLGTFRIFPFRTEHDTPEPVGYLLYSRITAEKLLYFTDSYYIKARFSGVTHIIGECNYDSDTMWSKLDAKETQAFRAKRLFVSHMSLDTFCDFLSAIEHREKLKQIYICHMSDDHGNSEKIKETIERLTGAEVYICEREGL